MYFNSYSPTRKAILIGSPGNKNNFLRGVKPDLKNLSKYLQSEKGGVWYEREIKSLYDPSYIQVKQEIENSVADYVIVYFSGHGYTDAETNQRMICLKDLNISDEHLLNKSRRQLVLIDACRNKVGQGLSGLPDYGQDLSYFEGSPGRALFDECIKSSPAGKLIIHGTQQGEFSYDSSTGGMFTNALINIGTRIKADAKHTAVEIGDVLACVPKVLQNQNNFQRPSVAFESGNLRVPFAIGVPKLHRSPATAPRRPLIYANNNSSNGGWLILGLLGLVALGIAASSSK